LEGIWIFFGKRWDFFYCFFVVGNWILVGFFWGFSGVFVGMEIYGRLDCFVPGKNVEIYILLVVPIFVLLVLVGQFHSDLSAHKFLVIFTQGFLGVPYVRKFNEPES
jgi:hypothetical protein